MARLMEKLDLVLMYLSQFGRFVSAILRKRMFLLFLLMDVLAFTIQWVKSGYSVSQVHYIGLVFVGFVLSAFQAYRDLLSPPRDIPVAPVEKEPTSKLSASFIEGNEYAYSIFDPYDEQNINITRLQKTSGPKFRFDEKGILHLNGHVYYVMGRGRLDVNIRITNSGDLPLDVLAIRHENDLDLRYLDIRHEGVYHNGIRLQSPLHLNCGESAVLQSRAKVSLGRGSKEPEFAADFRSLPGSILHEVSFDTKDMNEMMKTYSAEIKIPSKPLIDLYVKQWQEYDQDEYLLFAGYGLTPDSS